MKWGVSIVLGLFLEIYNFNIYCNIDQNLQVRSTKMRRAGLFQTEKTIFPLIRQYIERHGFGEPTPELNRKLSADVFVQHYYEKTTLMDFCRRFGIGAYGGKKEITDRIERFLRTGQVINNPPPKATSVPDSELGLSLDRQVINYKSDPVTRSFFADNIPGFVSFSAYVQKWTKEKLANGEVFTYRDVIQEHKRYMEKRRQRDADEAVTVAHDSCEMNQFYIDFSRDLAPKSHQVSEAWALVRDTAGPKTYQHYKEKINEIIKKIQASQSMQQVGDDSNVGAPAAKFQ